MLRILCFSHGKIATTCSCCLNEFFRRELSSARSAICQLLKHYGGVIPGKVCLLLQFRITESNLTVQEVSSSEF